MTFFGAKVIIFEGADGSGKTTQIRLLKSFLEKNKLKVYTTREPGGCPAAEKMRKLFLSHEKLDVWSQVLLCSAARNEHLLYLEELQKKENFDIIIFDRFIDSTLAYQIYPFNLSPNLLFIINKEMKLNLDAERTFILDIHPDNTPGRKKRTSGHYDTNFEFLKKVREAYLMIHQQSKDKILIDSTPHPKMVNKKIIKYIIGAIVDKEVVDMNFEDEKVDNKKKDNNVKEVSTHKKKSYNSRHNRRRKNVKSTEPKSSPRREDNFF